MSLPLNAEKPLGSIEVKEMRIDTTAAGTRLPAAPDLDVPSSIKSSETTPPATNGGSTPSSGQTTGTPASTVSSGPIKLPFDAPLLGFLPPPPADLSPEQEKKYRDLLAVVSAWTTVPISNVKDAASTPIQDEERMWLTRECLLRYLRASKWNMNEAPKRLHATLIWRREYGVAGFSPDYISPENETGKQVILGYDIAARPCLYLRPGMQNTERSERQIQHLVFMLELVIDLMVPGQDTTTLLCNFKDSGKSSNPTVGQGRQVMTILQGHYPERLGRALISNVPWAIWGFFKLITPFIDPNTREKMKFNEDLRLHVPPAQLWSIAGGDVEFEYDHSAYWPTLCQMAKGKRAAYVARWIKAGKQIGESEAYLKGGKEMSVGDTAAGAAAVPTVESNTFKGADDREATNNADDVPGSADLSLREAAIPDIQRLKV